MGTITPEHGGRIGNPPHVKTPELIEQVTALARALVGQREIAALTGINRSTLQAHYREEMDKGRSEVLAAIAAQEVKAAIDGDHTAKGSAESRRFVLVRNLWNKQLVEHSGPDGGPIEVVDLTRLSKEELELYGRLAARAEGLDPDTIVITATAEPR